MIKNVNNLGKENFHRNLPDRNEDFTNLIYVNKFCASQALTMYKTLSKTTNRELDVKEIKEVQSVAGDEKL